MPDPAVCRYPALIEDSLREATAGRSQSFAARWEGQVPDQRIEMARVMTRSPKSISNDPS